MNLLKLLGLIKKTVEDKSSSFIKDAPYPYKDILHLWEDDYLMLELLPNGNWDFVKVETQRINNFAQEHFEGNGFTDITPISKKPFKTIEKLIELQEVECILTKAGLEKIVQFHMQGIGLLQGDKAPLGFGSNRFAIMCDKENIYLKNIWVTGHANTEEEKQKLGQALILLGHRFNFIAVNWYQGQYYNLSDKESVKDFVKNSC